MPRRSLESLRTERGWSMRELARRAGVDVSQVHHWERETHMPRADTMRKIVAALDVTCEDVALPREESSDA